MPLNVRGLIVSSLLVSALAAITFGQGNQAELTQQRISKAKTLVATRNLTAAAFELEKIRQENADDAALNAANVMLTGIYLEQGDYNRVQNILNDSFQRYSQKKNGCYFSVVGQILKGARSQTERYKQLGMNITDAKLPPEITADLERWRTMLEAMLDQTKQLAIKNQKTTEAYVLLEDITNARINVARDDYDAQKWRTAVEDVREMASDAQTSVTDVEDFSTSSRELIAQNAPTNGTPAKNSIPSLSVTNPVKKAETPNFAKIENTASTPNRSENLSPAANLSALPNAVNDDAPILEKKAEIRLKPVSDKVLPAATNSAANAGDESPSNANGGNEIARIERKRATPNEVTTVKTKAGKDESIFDGNTERPTLMAVGSLVDYATRKVSPVYPPIAKNARVAGVVRVDVLIDEQGSVTDVQNTNGPELLRRAAAEAIKRWKFKPMIKDGQPVRVSGFINFNFTL